MILEQILAPLLAEKKGYLLVVNGLACLCMSVQNIASGELSETCLEGSMGHLQGV